MIPFAPRAGEKYLRSIAPVLALCLSACSHPSAERVVERPWYAPINEAGEPVAAVFEGRIPCADDDGRGCEKVKVALALHRSIERQVFTSYQLRAVYVGVSAEGKPLAASGSVTSTQGTAFDARSTVIELDASAPPALRSYWLIGGDILFLLDGERKPRVGTAAWSYVLNRLRPVATDRAEAASTRPVPAPATSPAW